MQSTHPSIPCFALSCIGGDRTIGNGTYGHGVEQA